MIPVQGSRHRLRSRLEYFAFGIDDGNLYSLDASTSKERRSYNSGMHIVVSPDSDGDLVKVANANGSVLAFDRASGKFCWFVPIGSAVFLTPVAVDGHVIGDGSDGSIYAFDDPNDEMAAT